MNKIKISAKDGFLLAANFFQANTNVKGIVIIGSATAANKDYYNDFARFLNEWGYHVISFDYRGVGDSFDNNFKSFNHKMTDWGSKDLSAVIDWAGDNYPTSPIFLVGHSVLGQVFPLAANNKKVKAAYFVASQMAFYGHWSGISKLSVMLFWFVVIPFTTRFFGYLPVWILGGDNHLPASIAQDWQSFGQHKNGILGDDPIRKKAFETVSTPIKFIGLKDDDKFAPPKSVEALKSVYGAIANPLEIIDPEVVGSKNIGHFGFFRKRYRQNLWPDIIDWFENHPQN